MTCFLTTEDMQSKGSITHTHTHVSAKARVAIFKLEHWTSNANMTDTGRTFPINKISLASYHFCFLYHQCICIRMMAEMNAFQIKKIK